MATSGTETQKSWASGRRRKVALLTLLIALAGSAATTFFAIAAAPSVADRSNGLPNLIEAHPWVAPLQHISVIGPLIAAHPLASAAIFGFIGGLASAWATAGKLHDRFLAAFNNDVLKPVTGNYRPDREPRSAAFVELPWLLGTGARATAWRQLLGWLRKDLAKREGVGVFSKPVHPLTIAILTGRAGTGKSRMAYELARAVSGAATENPLSTFARLKEWARIAFTPSRLGEKTRWDAGLLPPPALAFGRDHGLAEWRPRRPTLILLDDPGPGQVPQIWSTLQANAPAFRYAVRLLVTNQSVPYDSGFAFSDTQPETSGWTFQGSPAQTPPIALPVEAWFSEGEVRMLAKRADMGGPAAAPQSPAALALHADLFRVTRGNPLLVQLAFEWVREKKSFEDVSADALSEARVERIFSALRLNRVNSSDQFAALALATLVGGVRRDALAALGMDRLPSNDDLQACFPTDDISRGELPPVRPELIADRFVDRVIHQFSIPPMRLAENGFRLSPSAMLRVLRRARPATSALGTALIEIDPATIDGIDPAQYTLALAELATICRHDEWPRTTKADRKANVERARAAIAALAPAQRATFRTAYMDLLQATAGMDSRASIRVEPALTLYTAAISDIASSDAEALADDLDMFGEWVVAHGTPLYGASDTTALLVAKLEAFLGSHGLAVGTARALALVMRAALLDIRIGATLLPTILATAEFAPHGRVDARLLPHLAGDPAKREDLFRLVNTLTQDGRLNAQDAIVAGYCLFLSLDKVGDFNEELETDRAYKQWAELGSNLLRQTSEIVNGGDLVGLLQIALLAEARFWAYHRVRGRGVSSVDHSDTQIQRLWKILTANLVFAHSVGKQPMFDTALFAEATALLLTVAAHGNPSISTAFAAFLEEVDNNVPKRNRAFLGRVQLAEIYANTVRDNDQALARFGQSIFQQRKGALFEGYHDLELEACRLAHICACENPDLDMFAFSLEERMRRLIDTSMTELSEDALVWARLE